MQAATYTIAVLGGTGNEGPGLAMRWAVAGHTVIIGSRKEAKAQRIARELNEKLGAELITGKENPDAARACDLAVLTVPYHAQNALLETLKDELQGKILINVTVAMKPPKVTKAYIPPEGSACEQAQEILGDNVIVVAAFQNVGAHNLEPLDHPVACDVLVCGDDTNAKVVEGLTSVLIGINKRYEVPGSGIRITGLPE